MGPNNNEINNGRGGKTFFFLPIISCNNHAPGNLNGAYEDVIRVFKIIF